MVSLRAYADTIKMVAEGNVVAEHARAFWRGQTLYDWRHYLPVLDRKPGAPFADLPPVLQRMQELLMRRPGGDREMTDILGCVPRHGLDDVLVAVELALEGSLDFAGGAALGSALDDLAARLGDLRVDQTRLAVLHSEEDLQQIPATGYVGSALAWLRDAATGADPQAATARRALQILYFECRQPHQGH